jgi:hypothetical protein
LEQHDVGLLFNKACDLLNRIAHKNTADHHQLSQSHLVDVDGIDIIVEGVSSHVKLLLLDTDHPVVCSLLFSFKVDQV